MEEPTKKLYRSRSDRRLAGVCGGLAAYFNIDATLIRLLFVLGLLFVGGTLLAYIILMIVIPEEPTLNLQAIDKKPEKFSGFLSIRSAGLQPVPARQHGWQDKGQRTIRQPWRR